MGGKRFDLSRREDPGKRGPEFEEEIGRPAVVGSEKLLKAREGRGNASGIAVGIRVCGGIKFRWDSGMNGGEGQIENGRKRGKRDVDIAVGINGGFGFGGGLGERSSAEISGGTLGGVSDTDGGGSVVGSKGIANLRNSGGLRVGEALKQRLVALAIATGAL